MAKHGITTADLIAASAHAMEEADYGYFTGTVALETRVAVLRNVSDARTEEEDWGPDCD